MVPTLKCWLARIYSFSLRWLLLKDYRPKTRMLILQQPIIGVKFTAISVKYLYVLRTQKVRHFVYEKRVENTILQPCI